MFYAPGNGASRRSVVYNHRYKRWMTLGRVEP